MARRRLGPGWAAGARIERRLAGDGPAAPNGQKLAEEKAAKIAAEPKRDKPQKVALDWRDSDRHYAERVDRVGRFGGRDRKRIEAAMKVTYTIGVRPGVSVPVPPGTAGLAIGAATVTWKVNEGGQLEAVEFVFAGAEMRYAENGAILPTYQELEEEAYRLVNFVADRLFVQTGFDAIDPSMVFSEAPAIVPEDPREEIEFKTKYKSMWKAFKIDSAIRGHFAPAGYGNGFKHSAAHGYVADALRAASSFQQFELLYKVVEYFFSQTGSALPEAVSAHISPHDATYTPAAVEQLQSLRNKSIHPRARKGHVNPQNIAHVREVHAALPRMQRLSSLLLAHPTF